MGDDRLCQACGRGDVARVRALLDAGVPPDPVLGPAAVAARRDELAATIPEGPWRDRLVELAGEGAWPHQIPLFVAVEADRAEVVALLLARGARADVRDTFGRTAFFVVASVEVGRRLLAAGLDLDATNGVGWTALVDAVCDGALDRARVLLDLGADPNGTHDRGYTVLHSASSAPEHAEAILRLLVARGADPHARTELGWTVFHAAIDVNGVANEPASVRERLGTLRALGVDPDVPDHTGWTPLMRAVACGTPVEISTLLDVGADPAVRDPQGATAADHLRRMLDFVAPGDRRDGLEAVLRRLEAVPGADATPRGG